MKKILKIIVNTIHKLLVYFMFFGVFLPKKYLLYFIIVLPFVHIHWQFNNHKCILTELEYYLDGKPPPPTVDKQETYPFMKDTFSELGMNLTDQEIYYVIMYGYTFVWIIGMIRYFTPLKR